MGGQISMQTQQQTGKILYNWQHEIKAMNILCEKFKTDRQADTQAGRQASGQANRQTDVHTYQQTDEILFQIIWDKGHEQLVHKVTDRQSTG